MYILNVCIWVLYYKLLLIDNQNIKRNFISLTHSILCIIFCSIQYSELIYYLSTSYYTFDLIMQLLTTTNLLNTSTLTLGFHHIISIYGIQYLLTDNKFLDVFMFIFMLLEISNIPVYIMYYWKHVMKNIKLNENLKDNYNLKNKYFNNEYNIEIINYIITKILLMIEIIFYLVFRMSYSLYLTLINIKIIPNDLLILFTSLYLLSIFWWINMIHQLND